MRCRTSIAKKEELIPVAKAYCKKFGFEFLFVSDDGTAFGYEMPGGRLVHKSFMAMAEEFGYGQD